jgi:hypothetical protein
MIYPPPDSEKAAMNQLYLKIYATVALFLVRKLSLREEVDARNGKWPTNSQDLDMNLINLLTREIFTVWGMRPRANGALRVKTLSNLLTRLLTKFHPV